MYREYKPTCVEHLFRKDKRIRIRGRAVSINAQKIFVVDKNHNFDDTGEHCTFPPNGERKNSKSGVQTSCNGKDKSYPPCHIKCSYDKLSQCCLDRVEQFCQCNSMQFNLNENNSQEKAHKIQDNEADSISDDFGSFNSHNKYCSVSNKLPYDEAKLNEIPMERCCKVDSYFHGSTMKPSKRSQEVECNLPSVCDCMCPELLNSQYCTECKFGKSNNIKPKLPITKCCCNNSSFYGSDHRENVTHSNVQQNEDNVPRNGNIYIPNYKRVYCNDEFGKRKVKCDMNPVCPTMHTKKHIATECCCCQMYKKDYFANRCLRCQHRTSDNAKRESDEIESSNNNTIYKNDYTTHEESILPYADKNNSPDLSDSEKSNAEVFDESRPVTRYSTKKSNRIFGEAQKDVDRSNESSNKTSIRRTLHNRIFVRNQKVKDDRKSKLKSNTMRRLCFASCMQAIMNQSGHKRRRLTTIDTASQTDNIHNINYNSYGDNQIGVPHQQNRYSYYVDERNNIMPMNYQSDEIGRVSGMKDISMQTDRIPCTCTHPIPINSTKTNPFDCNDFNKNNPFLYDCGEDPMRVSSDDFDTQNQEMLGCMSEFKCMCCETCSRGKLSSFNSENVSWNCCLKNIDITEVCTTGTVERVSLPIMNCRCVTSNDKKLLRSKQLVSENVNPFIPRCDNVTYCCKLK